MVFLFFFIIPVVFIFFDNSLGLTILSNILVHSSERFCLLLHKVYHCFIFCNSCDAFNCNLFKSSSVICFVFCGVIIGLLPSPAVFDEAASAVVTAAVVAAGSLRSAGPLAAAGAGCCSCCCCCCCCCCCSKSNLSENTCFFGLTMACIFNAFSNAAISSSLGFSDCSCTTFCSSASLIAASNSVIALSNSSILVFILDINTSIEPGCTSMSSA